MIIFSNYPLVAAFISILFAQFIKFPIAYITKKATNFSIVTSTGGMPSSHSAAVASLITALILEYGFASPYVAIATTFGVIVMFDSMGVRRQSGDQGILLSSLHLFLSAHPSYPISSIPIDDDGVVDPFEMNDHLIIKKYLGHKPLEVLVGVCTGVCIALLTFLFY